MPEAGQTAAPVTSYRGRFAPSPTGPLHAGSVMAALASYLDARAAGGAWLLRMEDLDPPRESPEAAAAILGGLEALGLHWDGDVLYQSTRGAAYEAALDVLRDNDLCFECACSRQDLAEHGGRYPGTCRDLRLTRATDTATRCRVPDETLHFDDELQGHCRQNLEREVGDFIVRRKDGLFAYQLAVVVDDQWQGVTHVVRGIDLLDSTPRQLYLQRLLGLRTPAYTHIPVLVDTRHQKLSKQNKAPPVDCSRPEPVLLEALGHLRQEPDPALRDCGRDDILRWASTHWRPQRLRGLREIPEIEAPLTPAV